MTDEKSPCMHYFHALDELEGLGRSRENLDDKLSESLGILKQVIAYDSASLFLYDHEKELFEEATTVGMKVDLIETAEIDSDDGASARDARQCHSVFLPDAQEESAGGFRSVISVPLINGDELVGIVNIGHKTPFYFTEEHRRFLEIFAGQIARMIERVRFEQVFNENNTLLERARETITEQEERIRALEKREVLTRMAASINHEINNPLTTIIGTIELLLMMRTDLDETLEKKLRIVLEESHRVKGIIEKFSAQKRSLERHSENCGGT